jgi:hypothetical protein
MSLKQMTTLVLAGVSATVVGAAILDQLRLPAEQLLRVARVPVPVLCPI